MQLFPTGGALLVSIFQFFGLVHAASSSPSGVLAFHPLEMENPFKGRVTPLFHQGLELMPTALF